MARKTDLTPAAARNHPSLKDWISTETNVEWLKSLIVDPRFLAVCHYVQDKNRVTVQDLVGSQAQLPEVVVRKAALHAGASEFVKGIIELIPTKTITPNAPLEAWEHIHPSQNH